MDSSSYINWKDQKTKPFRMAWLGSVQQYEQQTDRYYVLYERYSRGEIDYDQLSNAYTDKDRARRLAETALETYGEATRRFDLKLYFQEQQGLGSAE